MNRTFLGTTIVDEQGGPIAAGVHFRGGQRLTVGGNLLEVRRWQDRKVEVRRSSDNLLVEACWGYRSRAWMRGVGQPEAVRKYLGIPAGTWPVVEDGRETVIFHFGGGRRRAILEVLCELSGQGSGWKINEWYIRTPNRIVSKLAWLSEFGQPGQL